jgi:hypothetical protein
VIDATRAAMMLALPLTDEKLDSLERGAGDGEIAGRGRTGGGLLARPSTGCAPVSLPKISWPQHTGSSDYRVKGCNRSGG